jgi:hypothetical protein
MLSKRQRDEAVPHYLLERELHDKKRARSYVIQHIKLISLLRPSFEVWWLGYRNSTVESYDHLVSENIDSRMLDVVVEKGISAKKSTWTGISLRSGREVNLTSVLPLASAEGSTANFFAVEVDFATEVKIRFQCPDARCVPYSFLNLLSLNLKAKNKLIKQTKTLCTLAELCRPVGNLFGKQLRKLEKDLPWILVQSTGLFLIVDTLHCVGIDCERQLIFDCALPNALRLCNEALIDCGIMKVDEMRKVE